MVSRSLYALHDLPKNPDTGRTRTYGRTSIFKRPPHTSPYRGNHLNNRNIFFLILFVLNVFFRIQSLIFFHIYYRILTKANQGADPPKKRSDQKKCSKKKFHKKVLIFYFSNMFHSQPLQVSLRNSYCTIFGHGFSPKTLDFGRKLRFIAEGFICGIGVL